VIVHGRKQYVYVVPPDQEHGSSMTATILHDVIADLDRDTSKPVGLQLKSPIALPRVTSQQSKKLWVQLDNTSGENKNNYVMGYLALLVETGRFEEVCSNLELGTNPSSFNFAGPRGLPACGAYP
jgi:hypothetical protein